MSQDIQTVKAKANDAPDDVLLQIEAAYALDSDGDEHAAVTFYDRAYSLGVPADDRTGFLLGYGSTLKNVGRLEESEKVLMSAIAESPDSPELRAFLALTYHAQKKSGAAIAELLRIIVSIAPPESDLKAYTPALGEYADELVEESSP